MCLAGPEGEREMCGPITDDSDRVDHERARAYLARQLDPLQVGTALARFRDAAQRLIRSPWAQQRIRLLADALLRHGTLSAEQIVLAVGGTQTRPRVDGLLPNNERKLRSLSLHLARRTPIANGCPKQAPKRSDAIYCSAACKQRGYHRKQGRRIVWRNERHPKFPPLYDDDLALPDLAQWVAFYGGYDKITSRAWAEWDRLYEVRQRMQKLSARVASK
jgi:hypothetical protein